MELQLNPNEVLCVNVKAGDQVWLYSQDYHTSCWGYAQSLHEHGLLVRLELPADHPSMQEVMAETGMSLDEIELIQLIPFKDIKYIRAFPSCEDRELVVSTRPLTTSERAERARRNGFKRIPLPELDLGLRNR